MENTYYFSKSFVGVKPCMYDDKTGPYNMMTRTFLIKEFTFFVDCDMEVYIYHNEGVVATIRINLIDFFDDKAMLELAIACIENFQQGSLPPYMWMSRKGGLIKAGNYFLEAQDPINYSDYND